MAINGNPDTVHFNHTEMLRDDYVRMKEGFAQERQASANASRALYRGVGKHEMPEQHLPAGISDPVTWDRAPWLDRLEARDFTGASLPLNYAPEPVQEARGRMDKLHSKLTAIEEVAEALCVAYQEQGDDVKAAMTQAALDGKDPIDSAAKIEKQRADVARKYHDAVLKRDAFFDALSQVYSLVEAETRKGLPAWHDAMLKARQEKAAQVAALVADLGKTLVPLMGETLTLVAHGDTARDGLNIEGGAPDALVDIEAVSQALGALEAAPSLWDALTTDPVLSLDAEHYERAHVAPTDWDAFDKRAQAIEAYRQHFKRDPRDGGGDLTHEEAAAVIDGPLKDRFGTGFSGY